MISITRSLGDHYMKEWVIPDPYQSETIVEEGDILVLACDGLWDVVTNAQVANIINILQARAKEAANGDSNPNQAPSSPSGTNADPSKPAPIPGSAQHIAEALVNKAISARTKDNLSVMVVYL